jgi:hypothetical protein
VTGFTVGMIAGALWLAFFLGLGVSARRSPGKASRTTRRFRRDTRTLGKDVEIPDNVTELPAERVQPAAGKSRVGSDADFERFFTRPEPEWGLPSRLAERPQRPKGEAPAGEANPPKRPVSFDESPAPINLAEFSNSGSRGGSPPRSEFARFSEGSRPMRPEATEQWPQKSSAGNAEPERPDDEVQESAKDRGRRSRRSAKGESAKKGSGKGGTEARDKGSEPYSNEPGEETSGRRRARTHKHDDQVSDPRPSIPAAHQPAAHPQPIFGAPNALAAHAPRLETSRPADRGPVAQGVSVGAPSYAFRGPIATWSTGGKGAPSASSDSSTRDTPSYLPPGSQHVSPTVGPYGTGRRFMGPLIGSAPKSNPVVGSQRARGWSGSWEEKSSAGSWTASSGSYPTVGSSYRSYSRSNAQGVGGERGWMGSWQEDSPARSGSKEQSPSTDPAAGYIALAMAIRQNYNKPPEPEPAEDAQIPEFPEPHEDASSQNQYRAPLPEESDSGSDAAAWFDSAAKAATNGSRRRHEENEIVRSDRQYAPSDSATQDWASLGIEKRRKLRRESSVEPAGEAYTDDAPQSQQSFGEAEEWFDLVRVKEPAKDLVHVPSLEPDERAQRAQTRADQDLEMPELRIQRPARPRSREPLGGVVAEAPRRRKPRGRVVEAEGLAYYVVDDKGRLQR